MDGIEAQNLLADCRYDTDEIVEAAIQSGMQVVIPPGRNRKAKREYDRQVYKKRNQVERLFRRLKAFRRIFTRFEKLDIMFTAFIHIALIADLLIYINTP